MTLDPVPIGLAVAFAIAAADLVSQFRRRPGPAVRARVTLRPVHVHEDRLLEPISVSFPFGTVLTIAVDNFVDANGNPAAAPAGPPTFTVSDATVLSLNGASVSCIKLGTATLSFADGSATGSVSITVTPGPATGGTIVLTPVNAAPSNPG